MMRNFLNLWHLIVVGKNYRIALFSQRTHFFGPCRLRAVVNAVGGA
jgi:hypothetical protein